LIVVLVFVVAMSVLVLPPLGVWAGRVGARVGSRIGSNKRVRRLAPLLPTAEPVVAYAAGQAPPLYVQDMRKILLITAPVLPVFLIWFPLVMLLQARWHQRVEVLVTADRTAWFDTSLESVAFQ
jgi:hypothetical protein